MPLFSHAEAPEQCVLVQISDIHVGGHIENVRHRRIPRQKGHNSYLCDGLRLALQDVADVLDWPEDQALPVVVSGDLTQLGRKEDYKLVRLFLHDRTPLKEGHWGIGAPRDDFRKVPGNHDHWDGTWGPLPRLDYNGDLFPDEYPFHPWVMPPLESANGHLRLELFGVDSCSGFRDDPGGKVFQKGSIHEDHFKTLRDNLASSKASAESEETTVLRVLICHHSLVGPSWWKPCRMEGTSQRELLSVATEFDVLAVLTGHTHSFLDVPEDHGGCLHELRCASTLQGKNTKPEHGFYVHQVVWHSDGPNVATWYPHRYAWSDGGFHWVAFPEETIEVPR